MYNITTMQGSYQLVPIYIGNVWKLNTSSIDFQPTLTFLAEGGFNNFGNHSMVAPPFQDLGDDGTKEHKKTPHLHAGS